jgi:hypothetical protein
MSISSQSTKPFKGATSVRKTEGDERSDWQDPERELRLLQSGIALRLQLT